MSLVSLLCNEDGDRIFAHSVREGHSTLHDAVSTPVGERRPPLFPWLYLQIHLLLPSSPKLHPNLHPVGFVNIYMLYYYP